MWIGKYNNKSIEIDDSFFEQLKDTYLQPVLMIFERFEIFSNKGNEEFKVDKRGLIDITKQISTKYQ